MTYSVEFATLADADNVAALHYLSHTTSFAAFASPEWVASRRLDDYRAQWRKNLAAQGPRSRTWVARVDRSVVGMVRISPMPEEGLCQLTSMHVHPDHQRQGIGQALMKTAEAFIRDSGYRRAVLGVIHANHNARGLYEKAGWSQLEQRPTGVEGVPSDVYDKRFDPAH